MMHFMSITNRKFDLIRISVFHNTTKTFENQPSESRQKIYCPINNHVTYCLFVCSKKFIQNYIGFYAHYSIQDKFWITYAILLPPGSMRVRTRLLFLKVAQRKIKYKYFSTL